MKKILLLFPLFLLPFNSWSQNTIPNGDFENWNFTTYENPANYLYTSNLEAYSSTAAFNVIKTTDAYHGLSAVELTTSNVINGSALAYFLNTPANSGDINSWTGGMPYTQMPTGIRGYYKYNVATADSALIIIIFRKNSTSIGTYKFKLGGIKSNYTLFNFDFSPALSQTPDSVILGAVSSDYFVNNSGVPGSKLIIDSISFTGVSSQPELLNGDFEAWQQSQTPYMLNEWSNPSSQGNGVNISTDIKTGQYALELTSFLDERNGVPASQPGSVTTGFYNKTCDCMTGGSPFTNQIDTLAFWYKYAPSSTDNAQVSMSFKKNGSGIDFVQRNLTAASTYQYAEIPINLYQQPDSVLIQIQSSLWENSSVNFVGSTLKIDNMYFKSQLVYSGLYNSGTISQVEVFPTFSKGKFYIRNADQENFSYEIYNLAGVKVTAALVSNEIDLTNFSSGIYFVKIKYDKTNYLKKLIKL